MKFFYYLPVTVVPIFEPSVRGNTRSNETKPKPTKGVNVLVKTELLWITIVNKQPSYMTNSKTNIKIF